MIALAQVLNIEIVASLAVLVCKLLSRKVLLMNQKDDRNC